MYVDIFYIKLNNYSLFINNIFRQATQEENAGITDDENLSDPNV